MKALILWLVMVLLGVNVGSAGPPAASRPFPAVDKIIQDEGKFGFNDGSSCYLLLKDGLFVSWPLGQSGRTIYGRWKKDNAYVIQGKWGWVNGGNLNDDYREMRLFLYTPEGIETEPKGSEQKLVLNRNLSAAGVDGLPISRWKEATITKMYRCYFVLDGLVRIPKPKEIK